MSGTSEESSGTSTSWTFATGGEEEESAHTQVHSYRPMPVPGSGSSSGGGGGGSSSSPASRQPPPSLDTLDAQQLHRLLQAAVACQDAPRCRRLLSALACCPACSPWSDPEANCQLLVAAAAHGLAAVVEQLLGLPPAVQGGQPPFNPNMQVAAWLPAVARGALPLPPLVLPPPALPLLLLLESAGVSWCCHPLLCWCCCCCGVLLWVPAHLSLLLRAPPTCLGGGLTA